MNNRLLYNRAIVDKVKEMIEKYPFMRFGQILVNLDIVQTKGDGCAIDPFYEEPERVWNRIISNKKIFDLESQEVSQVLY